MNDKPQLKRPIGVTIIAIFTFIGGVTSFAVTLGYGNRVPLLFQDWTEMSLEEDGLTAYSVVTAMLGIVVAIAMFTGKRWAWYAVIILITVGIVHSLFVPLISSLLVWIFSVIFLLYLRKSNVKVYFGR